MTVSIVSQLLSGISSKLQLKTLNGRPSNALRSFNPKRMRRGWMKPALTLMPYALVGSLQALALVSHMVELNL